MLWDLPGADDDEKHYFERYGLGYFDALVIVSTDRLMATDVKLARKALEYRVPIFFVRNKADAVSLRMLFVSCVSVCAVLMRSDIAFLPKGHPVQDTEDEEEEGDPQEGR